MALAAFKSTSKRTSIGPRDNSAATTTKGRLDSSQNGAHRRTRSSDFSDNFSQTSSSTDSFLNGQMDFGSTTDNPLFRGSTVLEEASRLLEQSKGDSSHTRGRSLSRIKPNDDNDKQFEVVHGQRRGRSVSRNHSICPQKASNQKANIDSVRRGRSLSCCKYYESESDRDPAFNRRGQGQVKNIGIVENKRCNPNKPARDQLHQQGLRRCSSQQNVSQSLDGYSSCVSSVTDNEKSSMHPDVCVEEKTIKSVYEQIKSFRSDHPTGDTNATGLYDVIRSEVQRAVAEIRFDLEQAIGRKSLSSPASNRSIDVPQSKGTDNLRKEYVAQLEQSEKRARDLWAQFAVEEQRCQELTRIVKDLHPDPQLSQTQKPSRTRKNSAERRKMSKCLTESAQNYFDEYVSISTFEDSEMSSLEELENGLPAQDIKTAKGSYEGSTQDISSYKLAEGTFCTQQIPVHLETDGVVLPVLTCETNYNLTTPLNRQNSEIASDEAAQRGRIAYTTSNKSRGGSCSTKGRSFQNISNFSPKSIESKMSLLTRNHADKTKNKDIEKDMQSFGNATQEGCMKCSFVDSSSSYQDDEYLSHAYNEAILIENLKLKNIIDFGGLLLCNKLHI